MRKFFIRFYKAFGAFLNAWKVNKSYPTLDPVKDLLKPKIQVLDEKTSYMPVALGISKKRCEELNKVVLEYHEKAQNKGDEYNLVLAAEHAYNFCNHPNEVLYVFHQLSCNFYINSLPPFLRMMIRGHEKRTSESSC